MSAALSWAGAIYGALLTIALFGYLVIGLVGIGAAGATLSNPDAGSRVATLIAAYLVIVLAALVALAWRRDRWSLLLATGVCLFLRTMDLHRQ